MWVNCSALQLILCFKLYISKLMQIIFLTFEHMIALYKNKDIFKFWMLTQSNIIHFSHVPGRNKNQDLLTWIALHKKANVLTLTNISNLSLPVSANCSFKYKAWMQNSSRPGIVDQYSRVRWHRDEYSTCLLIFGPLVVKIHIHLPLQLSKLNSAKQESGRVIRGVLV